MRGNNSVADLLDTVDGILIEDADFTEREAVMVIDPEGDLFAVEFAAQLFPAPEVKLEAENTQGKDPRQVTNFARDKLNRSVALRVNPAIKQINIFGGAVIDTLRRLVRSQRQVEDAVRRLSRKSRKDDAALLKRIEELESQVNDLRSQLGRNTRRD